MSTSRYEKAQWGTIFNIWLTYILILVLISRLPHSQLPIMSWVTLSLYFLAFLITLFIVKADRFNRDAFVPFCILFLLNAMIVINIFIGDNFLFGSNLLGWTIYKHIKLIIAFFFVYSTVYYAAKHSLRPKNPTLLIAATVTLVTAIFIFHFKHFLFNPSSIDNTNLYLDRKLFLFHLFPPVAIVLYGLLSPLFKPKHGIYYHSIMFVLAFLSARQVFIDLIKLKNISLFGLDQIFLTIALLSLLYFLAQKLNFISTPTGQIYSQIMYDSLSIPNLKLETRDHREFQHLATVINYFYIKKMLIIPFFIAIVYFITYLRPPAIVSLNLISLAAVIFLVLVFFTTTYNRKLRSGGFYISPKTKHNKT